MTKALMGTMLLAALAWGVQAQEGNAAPGRTNIAADFSGTSASQASLFSTTNDGGLVLTNSTVIADAAPAANPIPAPAAVPAKPKYVFFGDRDDYRWQLGVGVDYVHFTSRAFDANMVGLNTTLTYFTNSWFGVEGSVITGFGSDVFPNSQAKIFGGAGGIRIGSRRARWEPWGHALVGGSHLQPQTAFGSRTSIMALAGIGVDYRLHARLSLRGEGDWLYTSYYSQSQNNFQIVAGVVLHF
jgi:opacity protein-like surface antigen